MWCSVAEALKVETRLRVSDPIIPTHPMGYIKGERMTLYGQGQVIEKGQDVWIF